MFLSRLHLRGFRTYDSLTVELGPGATILHGSNASGKTNLLEGIMVLATGRSPRTPRDADLIQKGKDSFYLKGLVERRPAPLTLEVAVESGKKKAVRINGKSGSLMSVLNHFPVIYFSPDEIGIVSGAPARRRNFIDDLCNYVEPSYIHNHVQYRYVLEQRNALLRNIREGRESKNLLNLWDEQFINYGAAVLASRLRVTARLNKAVKKEYAFICPDEKPGVFYRSTIRGLAELAHEDLDLENIPQLFQQTLEGLQDEETFRGFTIAGPHRDDLYLNIDGFDSRFFASQGQMRSLLLALKLAATTLIRESTGNQPVLLLDDVLSEFDSLRRRSLLSRLDQYEQVIITCADISEVHRDIASKKAMYHVMKGGQVIVPFEAGDGYPASL